MHMRQQLSQRTPASAGLGRIGAILGARKREIASVVSERAGKCGDGLQILWVFRHIGEDETVVT